MPVDRSYTPFLLIVCSVIALWTPAALSQPGRQQNPDSARAEQLLAEVAKLQAEVATLRQRVAQLEKENAELKAALPESPSGAPGKIPGKGRPSGAAPSGDFAAVPDEPLAAPEAALAWFTSDYADKIKQTSAATPAERQKAQSEVGAWVRAVKKHRGRVEWTVALKQAEPDPLKGGGTLRFAVVHPVSKKPYSDLIVSQVLSPAQWRSVSEHPEAKHWRLVGQYAAEARFNKDLEDPASTPMFIGPFAEMHTNLSVQTLTPVN